MYTLLFSALWLLIQSFHTTSLQNCRPLETTPVIEPGTIMSSADGGKTWRDLSYGLPSVIMPISLEAIGDDLYLGAQEGLYKGSSSLMMPNWKRDQLAHKDIIGIFSGRQGPYALSLHMGIFHYEPLTGMWNPMHERLQDKYIHSMTETRNGHLFAGCESGLYHSADRGKSWQIILQKGPVYQLLESGQTLMARTHQGVWHSADGGKKWNRSLQTIHAPFHVGQAGDRLVAISHGDAQFGIATPNVVYLSSDMGVTWAPATELVTPSLYSIHDLQQVGDTLYACSGEGIFRSDNMGATWISLLRKPENNGGFFKMLIHHQTLFVLFMNGC